jgi:hypothetical protein
VTRVHIQSILAAVALLAAVGWTVSAAADDVSPTAGVAAAPAARLRGIIGIDRSSVELGRSLWQSERRPGSLGRARRQGSGWGQIVFATGYPKKEILAPLFYLSNIHNFFLIKYGRSSSSIFINVLPHNSQRVMPCFSVTVPQPLQTLGGHLPFLT